ncbi:MAG: transporter substrate-binding domain-containing protein [Spirochaetaceae bacterium]|nr:transporter substrate-binding domain-containing protein [Spirochaetaceae bacterium]
MESAVAGSLAARAVPAEPAQGQVPARRAKATGRTMTRKAGSFRPWLLLLGRWALLTTLVALADANAVAAPEEKEATGGIIVVDDRAYAPFAFLDSEGMPSGLTIDLWRLWSRKTGIPVEFRLMAWEEALAAVREGRADAVGGLFRTPEREETFDFTQALFSYPSSVFFDQRIQGIKRLEDLAGFTVGVIQGDSSEELLRTRYGDLTLRAYPDMETLTRSAVAGEIKAFVADTPVALHYLAKVGGGEGFRQSVSAVRNNNQYAAVRKGRPELLESVRHGFSLISRKEIDRILAVWGGMPTVGGFPWKEIGLLSAIAAALLSAIMLWNIQLRRRVSRTTLHLSEANRELLRAQTVLRESESKYRSIFENAGDAIFLLDGTTIVDCNDKTLELFGLPRERLIGSTPMDLSPVTQQDGEASSVRAAEMIQAAHNGSPQFFEWMHRRPDGSRFHSEVNLNRVMVGGRYLLQAILRDVTERILAREKILQLNQELERKVEDRTRELLESNSELTSANSKLRLSIESLNSAQARLVRSEKLAALGQLTAGLAHELNTPIGALVSANHSMLDTLDRVLPGLPERITRLDEAGSAWLRALLEAGLKGAKNLNARVDPKTRRSIERRLAEAGVPDSGVLVDAIAELGLQELLPDYLPFFMAEERDSVLTIVLELASLRRSGEIIAVATTKATHVISSLRRHLNQEEEETASYFDLHTELESILALYHNKIKYRVTVKRDFCASPMIRARKDDLNQVWMNLVNNALQAMDYAGVLTIETRKDDGWMIVAFTDSGPGIPPEIQDRIFEPFFSTKKHGEGIGLGLGICKKIVERSGGEIVFESRPGKTRFCVRIPSAEALGYERELGE